MDTKTLADLEKMSPKELEKLGIRYLNESEFAKLGIQPFNFSGSNNSGFDLSSIVKPLNKQKDAKLNYIKNNKAMDKVIMKEKEKPNEYTEQVSEKASSEGEKNKAEKNCKSRRRPLFIPWWPHWRNHPQTRKKKVDSTVEQKKEKLEGNIPDDTLSPKILPAPTPIKDNETNQNNVGKFDLPMEKEAECITAGDPNLPDTAEKWNGDQHDSLEKEVDAQDNSQDVSTFKEEEENKERVFQLERCKMGIEIKKGPPQAVSLTVFKPGQQKTGK